MNENTEIDLEWAKRGGVVHSIGYELMKYGGKIFSDGSMLMLQIVMCHSPVSVSKRSLRMATREECESAGIEYVERPVSAEELAGLREDSEQLAFLTQQRGEDANFIDTYASGGMVKLGNGGWFKTPREAIRAAMKGGV